MRRTKIAIVGPYPLDPQRISGGIQAVICNLVKGLKVFPDLDLHVITVDFDQDLELVEQAGVSVHVLQASKRFGQLSLYLNQMRWIRETIDNIQPDLVHIHGTDMYGFATKRLKYPTVLTVHGILRSEAKILNPESRSGSRLFLRIKGFFNTYFEEATLRNVKNIIVISPYVEQMINGTAPAMYLVDNPVDDRFFELINRQIENRILFVGMIRARKGILHLLKAVRILKDNFPQIQLHIVGKVFESDYNDVLLHYVQVNQLNNNVTFRGLVSEEDLYREFEECSILILPSKEESSPMVIEQAMAAGIPVIGSKVGGIPYLIKDGQSGFVVAYGDCETMASKIAFLFRNSLERTQMGMQAKKEAGERFRLSAIAQKTHKVYRDLINKSSQE